MNLSYKSAFRKFVKKQGRSFQLVIEDAMEKIHKYPDMGEEKKGDLSGLRIHKFNFRKQEYLVAYKVQDASITVYMIDTHENFYRNLKRYIREVE